MKDNTITIVGNLGNDPELRFTASGSQVANLNVGVTESRLNRETGEWESAGVSWFRVTAWNQLAEHIAESLQQGDRVIVTGPMRQRSYVNRDNETQYAWELLAEHVGPSLQYVAADIQRTARTRPAEPATAPASEPASDTAPDAASTATASTAPARSRKTRAASTAPATA
jgi:single-strand DNA-binding protein